MLRLISFVTIVLFTFTGNAQRWKDYRQELSGGVGVSNFLGELGGADKIGTYGMNDLNWNSTRMAISASYRYKIIQEIALRGSLTYATVSGDDANTQEAFRKNRNIHFKSDVVEFGLMVDFFPIKEFTSRARSFVYGSKGRRGNWVQPYVFGGIAGFYYNPKSRYQREGSWMALQPLGTEGQGLEGEQGKYSRFSLAIPIGGGVKFNIDRVWSVGFEVGMRLTMTDYLDDTSTDYYNNTSILDAYGQEAAYFADPSLSPAQGGYGDFVTAEGQQRGNPDKNDAYMFAQITLNWKILRGRSNLPIF